MKPRNVDIVMRRGVSFELELIAQVKVYNYDPTTNIGPADLKRTHADNQEHYGFVYAYVDFATVYTYAELRVIKPWVKAGQPATRPLLLLNNNATEIILTNKSTKILIGSDITKYLDFDAGIYELLLTRADGIIDCLAYGEVTILGDKG